MKNLAFHLVCCFSLFLVVSCFKEENPIIPEDQAPVQLFATFGDETKTQLSDDGETVLWSPSDSINVFFGDCTVRFNALNKKATAATIFYSTVGSIMFAQFESANNYRYAYNPYNEANDIDNGTILTHLPDSVPGVAGTFCPGYFPSVSRSRSDTLRFYNVCGGIAVTLHNKNINRMEFCISDTSALSGNARISFDEYGKPVTRLVKDSNLSYTSVLYPKDGGNFQSGVRYYLPLAPRKIDSLQITFRRADGFYAVKKFKKSGAEVERSVFIDIENPDKDVTFKIDATSMTLDRSSLVMSAKGSEILKATVYPEGTDQAVTWKSSDTTVATVDENGKVTAADVSGSCTITATSTQNSSIKAECTVTVIKHVESVAIDTHAVKLWPDSTYTLSAQTLPSGCTEQGIVWESENEEIATVSDDGVVTAKAKGECKIYAKSKENPDIKDCCVVTVVLPVAEITLNKQAVDLLKNEQFQLTATVAPSDAEDLSLEWTTSDDAVATVSAEGLVTAVAAGSVTVTATSVMNPKVKASCTFAVFDAQDLSAQGTANCYIVSSSGYYRFKGNVGGKNIALNSPSSATVLWECKDITQNYYGPAIIDTVFFRSEAGYVYFKIPQTVENGNAVIAVKNSEEEILWSWHIWAVDGFDPEKSCVEYKNDAGTVMDRNLGCCDITKGSLRSTGLLYQWGRKDPFPPTLYLSPGKTTNATWPDCQESTSDTGTIGYTILHPMTFITKNSNNNDWYYSSTKYGADMTRWQNVKTNYDPCPYGWKVAPGGPNGLWTKAYGSSLYDKKYDEDYYGIDLEGDLTDSGTSCWYCGTGFYNASSMFCEDMRRYITIWSSTSNNNYAYCFKAYPNTVYNQAGYGTDCACGQAVRCVRDK